MYRVKKTFTNSRGYRAMRVEFYLPIPQTINTYGCSAAVSVMMDERFEASRLARTVAVANGVIQAQDEGNTLYIVEDITLGEHPASHSVKTDYVPLSVY